ncbi:MAG: excinuclease ABC subunit UvrA [Burkholderiaceae bacterium]|nr:excinuclease ABC subunit UvrA [Burkholderiaceae bacterium]
MSKPLKSNKLPKAAATTSNDAGEGLIRIRGARQHTLKNLDLDIRTNELTVVTGPSGSGKSSLVFDTLFAEGQRRYVETFSAYARQFLDRMDKPAVDRVDGVPPAIAIDQTNPVRSSRSTVGTMTELNDHLKLLVARSAQLFDKQTAQPVQHDNADSIYDQLVALSGEQDYRLVFTFPVELPASATPEEVEQWLSASGFTRIHAQREVAVQDLHSTHAAATELAKPAKAATKAAAKTAAKKTASKKATKANDAMASDTRQVLDVVADRLKSSKLGQDRARAIEAIEVALKRGSGHMTVYAVAADAVQPDGLASVDAASEHAWQFSSGLHCPESRLRYQKPTPSMFSFNSPLGACDTCRGFGRVIGVDYGLVIPNDKLSLRAGAIKTLQTPAWQECQDDLMRHGEAAGIPRDTPWNKLSEAHKDWVINGSPNWAGKWNQQWYGVKRFFEYLETKSYKMHIRVLLSKYRSYTPCGDCGGARLKTESLLWRLGNAEHATAALGQTPRFKPVGVAWTDRQLAALPGLSLYDLMCLPLDQMLAFFQNVESTVVGRKDADARAQTLLFEEITTRLKYLCHVGLGYLTLDRQSRTLSGGEVQRINLTTALGTSLVNTLFVLDEPSIGLHPRDMDRITEAMHRLRDAGNTLVVVEHDPAVMLAADRVIDMGPGPGERGGDIVFDGTPAQLRKADTLTGAYLGNRKQVGMGLKRMVSENTPRLILEGAREHNLQNVQVSIPLQRLVCVTGVSGSGKSTLVQDVLAPALLRHFGKPTDAPGLHDRLMGAEQLSDVVFVDQSPIGKTARSNPVSYVGAWDSIRSLLATAPLARERGYTASKFSFNGGDGRCPLCGGSGFEHVEMQFLSDVYLRCPDCDGQRYRPEVLEVRLSHQHPNAKPGDVGLNVADVLDLTVAQAVQVFAQERDVLRALQPIVDVGLDYVKLGQPVPTLSGGEAQRLKLAGFLAQAAKGGSSSRQAVAKKGALFMFDEPTTGLHFEDIATLMRALRRLMEAGHSVLVIEHNLDVIRASDWLIDLGPEGGIAGGHIVAQGTPEVLREHPTSHTAKAMRDYEMSMGLGGQVASDVLGSYAKQPRVKPPNEIQIVNAKEHNLKGISLNIPRGKFNVISGVSGSGKSTLAFDILFNEGQRRYLESLNAYARSIVQPAGRPEVDAVYGIPPTVAIEQRLSRGGRKSTVGTTTEVWHYLRLLYVKLGTQHCVHDGAAVLPQTPDTMAANILKQFKGQHIGLLAPLVIGRKGVYTELADWAKPRGYPFLRVDGEFLPTDNFPRLDRFKEHNIELPVGDLVVNANNETELRRLLKDALTHGKGVVHILAGLTGIKEAMAAGTSTAGIGKLQVASSLRACPTCATSYPELDPRLFSYNSKHGWCSACVGTGLSLSKTQRTALDDSVRDDKDRGREQSFAEPDLDEDVVDTCPSCNGTRLNAQARAVQFAGIGIAEVAHLSVRDVHAWVQQLKLSTREAEVARDLIPEIESRLQFLQDVGLGYLTLDRGAPTLSGGEAQRIRLAAQLGSNLQGVCYVLDEPTIGLHARDNQILLNALHALGGKGNTLVVVEHDEDTIRRADHLIDIGPSAGKRGGNVVAQGSVADVMGEPDSVTGRYLRDAIKHPMQARRLFSLGKQAADSAGALLLSNATLHNLQNVSVQVPLKRLVAITGVSGSGKSTLARDVLLTNVAMAVTPAIKRALSKGEAVPTPQWVGCASLSGYDSLDRVLEVDQTPIGKTPRSCPATYIGFWDTVRKLFAETLEAKARGYAPGRFSFNTGEGRCPGCEGQGMRTVEMSFLPDVKVLCETCHGARFNPETLAVTWRGKSVGDVLAMEVDEAVEFFASMPSIAHPLQLLKDVGLGYLTLGQPSPTLSGGEAQRIKLVTELTKVRDEVGKRGQKVPHTLYVLDEPTVGLHMADVEKLIHVLHRLVDAGHSVVVIEHDLDVIAEADWVIDLGPDGGNEGGQIVAAAPPEELVRLRTATGVALAAVLSR